MASPVIQTSFHAGEWAPALNARVDLSKYHSAAALALNFFVDYRGGLSSRMGTKYLLQAFISSTAVRLIGFQASFNIGYILEFGDGYIRFYNDGAPVLESAQTISAATKANPGVITVVGHNITVGQWFYVESVAGMTQLNGRYFRAKAVAGNNISLGSILSNANVDTTGYGTYTSGGTIKRVYTLTSPYAAADLALLKFAQNVDKLILTHGSYVPYVLTLVAATNWTLVPISFGASISAPSPSAATTLAAGSVNYAYVVTSVDVNGQESSPSASAILASKQDLRTVAGTNTISWSLVTGAIRYNVYKAELSYAGAVPSGESFGYIGFVTGTSLVDSNIAPDFSETPPIAKNPFQGAPVQSITLTSQGSAYASVPTVSVAAAPSGGQTATANATLEVDTISVNSGGSAYVVGDTIITSQGVRAVVASITGIGIITAVQPLTFPGSNRGAITSGAAPATVTDTVSHGVGGGGILAVFNVTWRVGPVSLVSPGSGYTSTPAVTFSSGAATATATLGPSTSGNPSVSTFFQQRMVLAGPLLNPQQFNMSQPGSYYNYNVSNPIQADDAIEGVLVSGQLNEIKSMIPMPSGLILFSNKAAWQIYGSSAGSPVSAIEITAQTQAYVGANDVPPIVANQEILFVQAKGSSVRNVSYSFYQNVFTGTDISVLSSHLFYGYTITEWAWAEEPFKIAWVIRDDGMALSLTFLKEQDLIGWTHHNTEGLFKSVATVTEVTDEGAVDAVYFVVEREINGTTVKYIERMADRFFESYDDPTVWCVDSGLQYSGSAATTFTGAEHLAGEAIVGLADGIPFTATVSATGSFTLGTAASLVTAGLEFTPQLQTLPIDLGNPTIQGKMKNIPSVTVRVQQTLGLQIGSTFSNLVPMKDLVLGNVGSATNAVVADLVTADAQTILDSKYQVPGQYCIEQPLPYPASILGVIPEITVGDTSK